jgi:hypothetical protein
MPKEIRRLAFSHTETTKAIHQYSQNFDMVLPEGKILHARFATAGEEHKAGDEFDHSAIFQAYNVTASKNNLILTFYEEDTFEHRYCNLKADFVSAALVDYCLKHKIMMPKKGSKILDVTEFNICLDIVMDITVEDEHEPLSFAEENEFAD